MLTALVNKSNSFIRTKYPELEFKKDKLRRIPKKSKNLQYQMDLLEKYYE